MEGETSGEKEYCHSKKELDEALVLGLLYFYAAATLQQNICLSLDP